MNKCEKELLCYKLKDLHCKKCCCDKCCDDCCDICICEYDCCDDKKECCDFCDCCVKPMEHLLKQFTPGSPIDVITDSGIEYTNWWYTVTFVCVYKSILTIKVEDYYDYKYIVKIPICHISAIWSPEISNADLLENECKSKKGFCKCCEKPTRNQLGCYCGLNVWICFQGYYCAYGEITKVSDGIVILDDDIAISTCKITSIELEVPYYYMAELENKEKRFIKVDELMDERKKLAEKSKKRQKKRKKKMNR
ncbi:hypothetical protein ACFIJ5_04715 [Haloimpatiens sp. FM7330]|uniref:hypothetical protein n=1 Tax=Haloimpatiens sp. FM7330 TaxID=3298610 RepID=UPI00363A2BD4